MSDEEDTREDDRILRSARRSVAHLALGLEGDKYLFRRRRERQQQQRRARAEEASRAFVSEAAASAIMATYAQQSSQASSSKSVGSTVARTLSQSTGVMASQPIVLTSDEISILPAALQEAQLQKALGEIKAEKERMIRRRARMQRRQADVSELDEMELTHVTDDVRTIRSVLLNVVEMQDHQTTILQDIQQSIAMLVGRTQAVLLTSYLRCFPMPLRNQLAGEANINVHNFPSFNKKALDLEAKIGHGHNPTTDSRKKTLPPNWKAKGCIMFVDNDGSTIELDDNFQEGVGSKAGSRETSEGGVVAAVAQKGEPVKMLLEIEGVVAKYPDLFEEPTGVVEREVVHAIEIIPGFSIPKGRIYRMFVETCQVCQRDKPRTLAPLGLLKPLLILEWPGESLSMDFMDTLVTNKSGMRYIFVIVDRFSKYGRLVAMSKTARTEYVIRMFKENWVRDFGLPKSIISDRDVRFTSELWKAAAAEQGT
ncbi:hypothetical protein CBR_g13062 [Chara braunii]|uniref:Integrase catalytic domain-containing protein n=1 Tax=Chara braunii TaxID=69332 RepID=A0A388KTF0_CHABU|nr:hypothetical protein CBR_g13062 [Chara braunii]|eukprot:GBG73341.1 hypothetical protein CBR_g13062 [Chara braunii]